jgi:hypothetical protein
MKEWEDSDGRGNFLEFWRITSDLLDVASFCDFRLELLSISPGRIRLRKLGKWRRKNEERAIEDLADTVCR